ncbi:MAG: hypothetical protein RJA22_2292 [Verrucomicrobiota bacterium]
MSTPRLALPAPGSRLPRQALSVLAGALAWLAAGPAASAQSAGDYRSAGSGAWNAVATWEQFDGTSWAAAAVTPTSADGVVTILNGHTVTVTNAVSVDQVVIDAGGQLTLNSGVILTIANGTGTDLSVAGTYTSAGTTTLGASATVAFASGGKYQHNLNGGTIPAAAWDDNSTCEVIGWGASTTAPSGLSGQVFGHFTWNSAGQTASLNLSGNLTNVRGNFTVSSTGTGQLRLTGSASPTFNIGGNLVVNAGILVGGNNSGTITFNVAGQVLVNGGTFDLKNASGAAGGGAALNVSNHLSIASGATLSGSSGTRSINFVRAGTQSFANAGTLNVAGTTWKVAAGATLSLGTNVITGTGPFNLNAGAGLEIGSPDGIAATSAAGNVQVSGARSFSPAAAYTYNGAAAQASGDGLPAGVASLILNNSAGLTLSTSVTATNLTLTSGVLATTTNQLNSPANGSITGANSARYINGTLQRAFGTGSGQSFAFPIGAGATYAPVSLANADFSAGGTLAASTATGEHPAIATSGLDPAKTANRSWTLTGAAGLAATACDVTLGFDAGDVDAGADPSQFVVRRYAGGSWFPATTGTRTATSTTATGVSAFGDFAAGEAAVSAIDHYDVTAATPQTAGTPFTVTVTAKDTLNLTVADSATVVTLATTGLAQIDANGDTTYGDNTKTLAAGVATFSVRDDRAETLSFTASDVNTKTGALAGLVIQAGPFTKLQLLVPGESAAPGTAGGKAGTPSAREIGAPFSVTVNGVDAYWNLVSAATDTVGLSSTDTAATLPASAALASGTRAFSVTLNTAGTATLTASNLTDGTMAPATSPSLTVNLATKVWQGDGVANAWDVGSTLNWTNLFGVASAYNNPDNVLFDDTGSASPAIAVTGTPTPTSITVDAAKHYTFGGAGSLSGATELTKNNTGTLTLLGAHSFTGKTIINGGTVAIGAEDRLGANPASPTADQLTLNGGTLRGTVSFSIDDTNRGVTLGAGGGTLQADNATTLTLANAMAGAGALTKAGAGALELSASNTYAGATLVDAGTLAVRNATALGAATNGTTVAAGAALEFNGNLTVAEPLTLAGSGPANGGALRSTADSNAWAGALTLGGAARINADAGTLTLSGGLNGAGYALTLGGAGSLAVSNTALSGTGTSVTKDGAGTLTLGVNSTFTGPMNLNGGTTVFSALAQLGAGTAVNLDGGTLVFGSGVDLSARTVTFNAGGGTLDVGANNVALAFGFNGTGAMTKLGSGELRFNNPANSRSGDTILAAGKLSVDQDGSFASPAGTLYLSGAILNVTAAGRNPVSAAIGNPVVLTADSILDSSSTSTSNQKLLAFTNDSFSGTGGSLTIRDTGGAGIMTLRHYGTGFTFTNAINVVVTPGAGVGHLAAFNAAGTQTFSGVIAGGGNFIRSASVAGQAGDTVLSGDNTFSGGVSFNDGGLGLGISSTGLPVTSGPLGTAPVSIGTAITTNRLFASGGPRTLGNTLIFSPGSTNTVLALTGTFPLTLAGSLNLGPGLQNLEVNNPAATVVSGVISNLGGLRKTGAGTLTLSGENTYAGGTVVGGGTLLVNNASGSGTGPGAVVVQAGATLAGNGPIAGAVTIQNGGTYSPGAGLGAQTLGSLTLNAGSRTLIEIDRTAATNDVIRATSATYGGTLAVTNSSSAFAAGDAFPLFTATSYSGSFSALEPATPGPGLYWDTTTLATDGILRVADLPSVTNPASTNAQCGGSVTLTVSPAGSTPLLVQWYAGPNALPGATGTNLAFNPVSPADAGNYYAVVSNGGGSVTSAVATLTVIDTAPPAVTLNGGASVTVECHTAFADPGATATDACAGSLSVTTSGSVDTNTPGTYTLTYAAVDPAGNSNSITRVVTVRDTLPPVVALNGASPLSIQRGATFTDPGATASDACAGSLSVGTNGSVNPAVRGTYTLTYAAVDPAGNTGTVTRTVQVLNNVPVANANGGATTRDQAMAFTAAKLIVDDTDADGDTLTVTNVSALSTNGGTVTLSAGVVTYTPVAGFTGVDRFTYTVDDGQGGTATAAVEVLVVSGELPSPNQVSMTLIPGGLRVRFAGIPGRTYQVQRTPSLTPATWSTLATLVAPLHGILEYDDLNLLPTAVYRTAAP